MSAMEGDSQAAVAAPSGADPEQHGEADYGTVMSALFEDGIAAAERASGQVECHKCGCYVDHEAAVQVGSGRGRKTYICKHCNALKADSQPSSTCTRAHPVHLHPVHLQSDP